METAGLCVSYLFLSAYAYNAFIFSMSFFFPHFSSEVIRPPLVFGSPQESVESFRQIWCTSPSTTYEEFTPPIPSFFAEPMEQLLSPFLPPPFSPKIYELKDTGVIYERKRKVLLLSSFGRCLKFLFGLSPP